MELKIIALDIYGTVLASNDADNELPPRKGTAELFNRCEAYGIKVVGASDGYIPTVKIDLKESGVNIEKFDNFFQLW